jgi:hypothetical protein
MDAPALARAHEDAWFDVRQASRHGDLASDERGRAELTERERIDQLLAAAVSGSGSRPAPTNSKRCASSGRWSIHGSFQSWVSVEVLVLCGRRAAAVARILPSGLSVSQ